MNFSIFHKSLICLGLLAGTVCAATRPARILPYGLKGDGNTDDSSALQRAVDAAILENRPEIILPACTIRLDKPILIASSSSRPQPQLTIRGAGNGHPLAGDYGTTYVRPTGEAAIFVQGVRGLRLENLAFIGPYAPKLKKTPEAVGQYLDDVLWDSAAKGLSINRFAPHAALVIDPSSGVVPEGGGYKALARTGSLTSVQGIGYPQLKAKSSDVQVVNCSFTGFVVGIALDPSGGDTMTSEIKLDRVFFQECRSGIALCKTQSENVVMNDVQALYCRRVVDGVTYGRAPEYGAPNPIVTGGNWSNCGELFKVHAIRGPLTVTGLYGEANGSIGTIGLRDYGTNSPASFRDCNLQFRAPSSGRKVPLLTSNTELHFDGGRIASDGAIEFKNGGGLPGMQKTPGLTFSRMLIIFYPDMPVEKTMSFAAPDRVRMDGVKVTAGARVKYFEGHKGAVQP